MESVEDRLARLEKQVAYLQRHLGADPALVDADDNGSDLPPDFYAALRDGKTIKAIKIYRETTGASLLTAKNAVEALERRAAASDR
jgi:ribosomal protein L7/L12